MVILKIAIVTMGFIYHLIGESHENHGNPMKMMVWLALKPL